MAGGQKMHFCAVVLALATFMSKHKCVTDNALNAPSLESNKTVCVGCADFLPKRAVTNTLSPLKVSSVRKSFYDDENT